MLCWRTFYVLLIAILFQSTEEKDDEDEEEEEEDEEKEVALMEENYSYKTPKPVKKKQDSPLMGFQIYALRAILQLLCKMEFDINT